MVKKTSKSKSSSSSKTPTSGAGKALQEQLARSTPRKLNVEPHPQIQEFDNVEDFRTYSGYSGIPDVPLVKQIEQLQQEAQRRERELKIRELNNRDSKTRTPEQRNQGLKKTSTSAIAARYRKAPKVFAQNQAGSRPGIDDESFEEELVYETDSDVEQPEKGPKIKKLHLHRRRKPNFNAVEEETEEGHEDEDDDEDDEGQLFFAILDYTQLLIPLLSAHIIFDILVRVQYAQNVRWENVAEQSEVLQRAAIAAPVLVVLHLFFNPHKDNRIFRIASFFASVLIGCYLVYISEEQGYYFVMKRAPPLGTLWLWLFFIMHWAYAGASLIVVVFWMWLHGYSI